MTFGERLVELRKERGFANRNDFANYIGMPSTTLRNYETNVREPGHIFLKQMADIFHVSIDYLLCMTDDKTPPLNQSNFSAIEIELIKRYRKLDDYGKSTVDAVLNSECERMDNEHLMAGQLTIFDVLDIKDIQELKKVANSPDADFSDEFMEVLSKFTDDEFFKGFSLEFENDENIRE